jgi:O-antigen/teichoic acid export membrane protein
MRFYFNIARDTFYQMLARLFTSCANFVLVLLIAKAFGSEGLGQYDKVFTVIGVFTLFVDFGINAEFLKSRKINYLNSLIILRLIISLSVFALIQPIIFIIPYDPILNIGFSLMEKIYIEILGVMLFLSAFTLSYRAIFQNYRRFDLLLWPNLFIAIASLSLGLYGYLEKNLLWFFLGTIVGTIASIFISYWLVKKNIKQFKEERINVIFMKELIRKSLPLGAMLFLNILYVRSDILIMSFLRPTAEVGIYTLAYKFFEFPLNISIFFMNSLYPIFLIKAEQDKNKFYSFISTISWAIFVFSAILSLCAFFGAPILGMIKQDFVRSIIPFRILISSYPIFFLTNLFLWVLITENREKILPAIYLGSLLINAILNVIFIPRYGYVASATITVFCEMLILVCFIFHFIKIKNLSSKQC